MALPLEFESLTEAISGMGVDENALISTLGKSQKEHRKLFRKASKSFFVEDEERAFEKCHDHFVRHLKLEFSRFNNAVVMWAMHPWERDARLVKKALKKGEEAYNLIVEVSCTRSAEDLLGARKAYHSLFDQSMEEDIASHVHGPHRKLLVGLVSAYRYEGNKVKDDSAKSEAKILAEAVASSGEEVVEKDEVVRILTTRSKLHLQHLYKHFNEIKGSDLLGGVSQSSLLNEALLCLLKPALYFSKILDASLNKDADKTTKKWLTRVFVTRADHSDEMNEIKEEFNNLYGETLAQRIQEKIKGNYRDFLLTLLSKSD
ncbi:ANNAT4 [Arabidopsis lyrata subsp. lyrata]|uniref:ANNAT4 n=1 Tax=Arabidopsis lyrata subsp. lyrata TaxID=81972 RepID=D7LCB4_ARALL|nr:annexin D4 [Arabidopsis lyrata subsp. lyrata]EFH57874.1 ANNAT4 [Arabidopsis lyrata subsp. lyrata]|eukprot:XP_020884583.1 annexin D4 [Arabidopsis lyrata subsp. lyrata]